MLRPDAARAHLRLLLPLLAAAACDCGEPRLRERTQQSLQLGPCPTDFGVVYPGANDRRELVLENTGPDVVRIAVAPKLPEGSKFFVGPFAAPLVLDVGDKHKFDVEYRPLAVGAESATLVVESDDPMRPKLECELRALAACDSEGAVVAERECYSGPPATKNVGACKAGKQTCGATGWSACTGEVKPRTDVKCGTAGEDIDCDGQPDQTPPPPTADAGPDVTVAPLDFAQLDGSGSHSNPRGGALTYQWRLISKPPLSAATLGATIARPQLHTDEAGDYVVGLVVTDPNRCMSVEDTMVVHAIPSGAVHIELTWNVSDTDLDLHYIEPNGRWFDYTPGAFIGDTVDDTDIFYKNLDMDVDWGPGGRADGRMDNNPTLDLDDIGEGSLKEQTDHEKPFSGDYIIGVHHYCAHDTPTTPTARIRVFLNRSTTPAVDVTHSITESQLWQAVKVTVAPNGVVSATALNKALRVQKGSSDCTIPTAAVTPW